MALANYTDLIGNVAVWIARSDLTSYIPDFVALFEAEFNQDPDSRYRQMETTTSLTPNSSGIAALPSDFLEVRGIKYTGDPARDLDYITPSYMTQAWSTRTTDAPQAYTIIGSNLQLNTDNETALTFNYYQKLPSLQTNSTNWLMTAYPNLYLAGVLVETYAFIQDAEKASLWKARKDNSIAMLRRSAFNDRAPMAKRATGSTP